jgi:hypothetical protein
VFTRKAIAIRDWTFAVVVVLAIIADFRGYMGRIPLAVVALAIVSSLIFRELEDRRDVEDARKPGASCKVHGVLLREDEIPITCGYPGPMGMDPYWGRAKRKHFPNACTREYGGCRGRLGRRLRVSYCPECRRVEGAGRTATATRASDIVLVRPDR